MISSHYEARNKREEKQIENIFVQK